VFQGVRGEALVVQSLTPGGPAELSGRVEVGDVLFTINEAKVADMDDSELQNFLHGMLLWVVWLFLSLEILIPRVFSQRSLRGHS
jgi:hypothetical protein